MFPEAHEVAVSCQAAPRTECAQLPSAAHPVSAGLRVGLGQTEGPGLLPPELQALSTLREEGGWAREQTAEGMGEALTARHRETGSSHISSF